MFGTTLAVSRCGMVKTTTIEELMGVTDEQLPDFSGMIARRNAGGADGLSFASESDRLAVRKNLQPYADALRSGGFDPVLLEIAVIHDSQLPEDKRGERSDRTDDPFFVSDVVSFMDSKLSHDVLDAWDSSIRRLLNPQLHGGVQVPIVTNPRTYTPTALYDVDLSTVLREAVSAVGEKRPCQLLEDGWPEAAACLEGANAEESRPFQLKPPTDASRNFPTPDAVEFRKLYELTWLGLDVEPVDSIRYLSRGFVSHLLERWCARQSVDALSLSQNENIKCAIGASHLLVVPFRRPGIRGTISSGARLSGHDNAEPGGCLFAVLCKAPDENGNRTSISDKEIVELSIRLNWLLARSALAEAFSELALKQDRDYMLAVDTHHIPTALSSLRWNVGISRDEIKKSIGKIPGAEQAVNHMNNALRTATRLQETAQILNRSQKSRDSGKPQCTFDDRMTRDDFVAKLLSLFQEGWDEAILPYVAPKERTDVRLDLSDLAQATVSLPANLQIKTSIAYARFVIVELLTNALRHGDFGKDPCIRAHLLLNAAGQARMQPSSLTIEVDNPCDHSDAAGGDDGSERAHPWRIGLTSLEAFTQAYGVSPPKFTVGDGQFRAEIPIAIA